MSTLYIRLPSQAVSGNAPDWQALPCPFALVTNGRKTRGKESHAGAIERQGVMPLPGLSGEIAGADRVVLLLAAVDVALLRVKVPPLSPAKLKAALPNLVEDQLIGDPSVCVVAADGTYDGQLTVAVVQRSWFGLLNKTLVELGARHIAALPAQLCLAAGQTGQPGQPDAPGGIAAAIDGQESGIDLTIRLSEHHGIGLTIAPPREHGEDNDPQQTAAGEIIGAILAIAGDAPVTLYVPQSQVQAYRQAAEGVADATSGTSGERIGVLADDWAHWIGGAQNAALDLMAGRAVRRLDWRPWRWPLALAAAVLLVNIAALNFDWWRKQSEANALRASMTRIYKAAYPKETVIIDPIAQMQQKIAVAKRSAGLPSPDDFVALAAAFAEAAASAMPGGTATSIAAIEYRERSLIVQLKPGVEAPTRQLQTLLAERKLSVEETTSGAAAVLRIRSAK